MSWDPEFYSEQIARKNYNCNACDWAREQVHEGIYSISDFRMIVLARRDNWEIKKGMRYIKVRGKWDGEWCTFRARPEINELCQRLDIYQE